MLEIVTNLLARALLQERGVRNPSRTRNPRKAALAPKNWRDAVTWALTQKASEPKGRKPANFRGNSYYLKQRERPPGCIIEQNRLETLRGADLFSQSTAGVAMPGTLKTVASTGALRGPIVGRPPSQLGAGNSWAGAWQQGGSSSAGTATKKNP